MLEKKAKLKADQIEVNDIKECDRKVSILQ